MSFFRCGKFSAIHHLTTALSETPYSCAIFTKGKFLIFYFNISLVGRSTTLDKKVLHETQYVASGVIEIPHLLQ